MADLVHQGWFVVYHENFLLLDASKNKHDKKFLQNQLLVKRNESLLEESVVDFLDSCESSNGKKSIKQIIHNGPDLARDIEEVISKKKNIREILKPQIQLVNADDVDKITGRKLQDIWRYLRLTWSLQYQTIPGREMPFLIRKKRPWQHSNRREMVLIIFIQIMY